MSIKESMMYMIEDKIPDKTREELVDQLLELNDTNRKEENTNVQYTRGSSENNR